MKVGIEALGFYTSRYYIDLQTLAHARGIDPQKYTVGLGQEKMAVLPCDEDIVTMAATSANRILDGIDTSKISLLLVATESSIDQSKAAGIWVHSLLKLSPRCRVLEVKQACYGGCAAMQLALAYIRLHPDQKVLLVATDTARYGLKTVGEPTQGCGASAILLSSNPKIVAFEPETGAYTSHVFDFWRPNYRDEALVDGKFSTKVYLEALSSSWQDYKDCSKRSFSDHARFCYHTPFTRMAAKAHEKLSRVAEQKSIDMSYVNDSLTYCRILGNSYTASLFIGLASLLETSKEELSGKRIGFFSYGSGCVAEFFSGTVCPDYASYLKKDAHQKMLDEREALSIEEYEAFYSFRLPEDGSTFYPTTNKTGDFRLTSLQNHMRIYSQN